MNIFVLDPDPAIAASYHCDQHLSKMILESAQMLSTAATHLFSRIPPGVFYKPAYPGHPCTKWCCASLTNCSWVVHLCRELESIRLSKGMNPHSSIEIIEAFTNFCDYPLEYTTPESFALAMPAFIKLRSSLTEVEKYREYYQYKHRNWTRTKKHGMTFTGPGRSIPPWFSPAP